MSDSSVSDSNIMRKSDRRKLSLSLYLNYFVHGIGLIILAQNMQALGHFWNVPIATVSYVISGIGIGKLIAYLLFGYLSDRFGRKMLVYSGVLSYMIFFIGIPFTHNIALSYVLAIIAGIANSALDSGTYPTFVEMGGNNSASNVFIKAFMSLGEFILPLVVAMIEVRHLWFGISFVAPVAVLLINLVILHSVSFPDRKKADAQLEVKTEEISQIRKGISTVALALYGYTTMAIMILFTQWITMFAQKDLGFGLITAHALLSLYSIGSISGVIITFILLKLNVPENTLLIVSNLISLVAIFVITIATTPLVSMTAAFVFGFTAAGGVLQVALNLLLKLFPEHKGFVTGVYMTFGSIATFTIPLITGLLSKTSIHAIMNFDVMIGVVGTVLVIASAMAMNTNGALIHISGRLLHINTNTTNE